jgi:hypothetical protein
MELVLFRSQATRKQILSLNLYRQDRRWSVFLAPCEFFKVFDRLVRYCTVFDNLQIEDDVRDNALLIQELGEDDVHYTPPGVWPARLGLSSSTSYR